MNLVPNQAELSQKDRAGFTLFTSLLIHIALIMGIGFTYQLNSSTDNALPSMNTTVVSSKNSSNEDIDTDLFAADSQQGGGLGEQESQVSSPLPNLNYPITRTAARINAEKQTLPRPTLTLIYRILPDSVQIGALETNTDPDQDEPFELSDEARQAMLSSALSAELQQQLSLGQKLDRQKFISSRTKEHKYASYMESWRGRVEQVGNLNYPEAAKNQQLNGSLVLSVTILSDGNIKHVSVVRSSGQKILDDAAVRIVTMAAPYDAFPDSIRKEADTIHITRTWQFLHNSALIQN
ncbi:MAG: protein TonB [Parasphingorhabdus sp.]|jgi:protein TonB